MLKHRISIFLSLCVPAVGFLTACGKIAKAGEEGGYQIAESEKLTVYTSHKEEVYQPIIREFEERTGIFVEVRQGGTLELFSEIAENTEEENCDIIFGGGIENYIAYQDYLEAYKVSDEEMIDQQYCCAGHEWTAFSVLPIVFIYNNKLVYPEAAPKTWGELQTQQWKGKVSFADPRTSGSSYTALCTMIQALGGEEDAVLGTFAQVLDGRTADSSGDVLEEVNSGGMLVGVTLEDTAREWISQGADFSFLYPEDGTSAVPDGAAIIKGAPHGDNAQKFMDFIVSYDVQKFLADVLFRRTVRTDVKPPDMEEKVNEMQVLWYDVEWAVQEKDNILAKWAELQKEP